VGACAACITVGILICVLTYSLRAVDFGPLRALISLEDRFYTALNPPLLDLNPGFHPIIFVDIDDRAVSNWDREQAAATGTPRGLIAQLVRIARKEEASVIFLDYDFRYRLPEDMELQEELSKRESVPILIPTFLSSGATPMCESQDPQKAPIEQPTIFDSTKSEGTVGSVHSIVALGAYGLVEGTCSFYWTRAGQNGELVRRMAVIPRALEIASLSDARRFSGVDYTTPTLISNRWWVRDGAKLLHDKSGGLRTQDHEGAFIR
jgi:CHASE2 domain